MRLWLYLALLRGGAVLVPELERAEWLAEWTSELWYVLRASGKRSPASFCLGAFRDALWVRQNSPRPERRPWLNSPFRCLFLLTVLAAASLFFALRLPGVREAVMPSPYRDARRLVTISRSEGLRTQQPTVAVEEYRALRSRAEFSGMAFYRPVTVRLGTAELAAAEVSGNLFEMLEAPAPPPGKLLLSERAWRKWFDSDPGVAVAGAVSDAAWRLPGRFDAWLLVDEQRLPAHSKGFVLGRVKAAPAGALRWRVSVPDGRGVVLECEPLARGPLLRVHLLMLCIALLILPAVTSLRLERVPGTARLPRWIFLAIKILLCVTIVFCGTLDLAWIFSIPIQPHGLLIGYVLALRWALADQRKRCPVCLRMLTNPARIGRVSQTLLEWCGTELMCARGHGLLHVPEFATSYDAERWLSLDESWSGLFAGAARR